MIEQTRDEGATHGWRPSRRIATGYGSREHFGYKAPARRRIVAGHWEHKGEGMKITKGLRMVGVAGCAAMLLIGCAAHKEESAAKAAPVAKAAPATLPSGMIGEATVTETVKVKAIDHKKRMVTLERSDGSAATFHVSKEVRNLPQVKAGDSVNVTYYESFAFAVMKPGAGTPGTTVMQGAARAEPGAKPGAVAAQVTTVTVTIVGIDKGAGTATVKGPEGKVVTVKARDPRNLDRVSIGDLVDVTYTEAIEIIVQAPAKHAAHKTSTMK